MEVWAPSHTSSTPFIDPPVFCWTSAFSKTNLMAKPFSPSTVPLQSFHECMDLTFAVKVIIPVILGDRARKTYPNCPHADAIRNWEGMGFRPVSHKAKWSVKNHKKNMIRTSKEYMSSDTEVKFYLCPEDSRDASLFNVKENYEIDVTNFDQEIEGPVSFPTHYGSYWQDLISNGAISLYPSFDTEQEEESMIASNWSNTSQEICHTKDEFITTCDVQEISDEQTRRANNFEKSGIDGTEDGSMYLPEGLHMRQDLTSVADEDLNKIFDRYLHCLTKSDCSVGAGHGMMCSTSDLCIPCSEETLRASTPHKMCPQDYDCVVWDSPWHSTEWDDINQDILAGLMGTKRKAHNPYLPPQLASCVKWEHSQFLQV